MNLLAFALSFSASAAERPLVYGYHAYWTDDAATLDFSRLSHVAIFSVGVESDGSLTSKSNWTSVAEEVVANAHAAGTKVHLCVTSFYDDEHDAIFGNPTAQAALVDNLADMVDAYGADGVNVDFEGLSSAHKDHMIAFVEALKERVDEVVLATPAVDWSGAWDYSELSAVSDGLFIMGYAYHYTGGNPGPNDPLYGGGIWSDYALDWTVDDYLDHEADPAKIILGLPLYGQQWEAGTTVPGTATGDAWSVPMDEAIEIAADYGERFDEDSRSPYAIGEGTQLWYPTHDSVQERIEFAMDAGLGGVGFWALDYEGRDPDFWNMVDEAVTPVESGDDSGDTDADDDNHDDNAAGDSGSGDPSGRAEVIPGESAACASGAAPPTRAGMLAFPIIAALGRRRRSSGLPPPAQR